MKRLRDEQLFHICINPFQEHRHELAERYACDGSTILKRRKLYRDPLAHQLMIGYQQADGRAVPLSDFPLNSIEDFQRLGFEVGATDGEIHIANIQRRKSYPLLEKDGKLIFLKPQSVLV